MRADAVHLVARGHQFGAIYYLERDWPLIRGQTCELQSNAHWLISNLLTTLSSEVLSELLSFNHLFLKIIQRLSYIVSHRNGSIFT
jgi:hypothetical protein